METNAPRTVTDIASGVSYFAEPARVEKGTPDGYRLARKPNGDLVLQGAYIWQQGRDYGHEWRDIPTVELSA